MNRKKYSQRNYQKCIPESQKDEKHETEKDMEFKIRKFKVHEIVRVLEQNFSFYSNMERTRKLLLLSS